MATINISGGLKYHESDMDERKIRNIPKVTSDISADATLEPKGQAALGVFSSKPGGEHQPKMKLRPRDQIDKHAPKENKREFGQGPGDLLTNHVNRLRTRATRAGQRQRGGTSPSRSWGGTTQLNLKKPPESASGIPNLRSILRSGRQASPGAGFPKLYRPLRLPSILAQHPRSEQFSYSSDLQNPALHLKSRTGGASSTLHVPYTISKDHTEGVSAYQAQLLACYGQRLKCLGQESQPSSPGHDSNTDSDSNSKPGPNKEGSLSNVVFPAVPHWHAATPALAPATQVAPQDYLNTNQNGSFGMDDSTYMMDFSALTFADPLVPENVLDFDAFLDDDGYCQAWNSNTGRFGMIKS